MKCAQEISIAQDLLFWLIPKHKVMITFKKHQKILYGSFQILSLNIGETRICSGLPPLLSSHYSPLTAFKKSGKKSTFEKHLQTARHPANKPASQTDRQTARRKNGNLKFAWVGGIAAELRKQGGGITGSCVAFDNSTH